MKLQGSVISTSVGRTGEPQPMIFTPGTAGEPTATKNHRKVANIPEDIERISVHIGFCLKKLRMKPPGGKTSEWIISTLYAPGITQTGHFFTQMGTPMEYR